MDEAQARAAVISAAETPSTLLLLDALDAYKNAVIAALPCYGSTCGQEGEHQPWDASTDKMCGPWGDCPTCTARVEETA